MFLDYLSCLLSLNKINSGEISLKIRTQFSDEFARCTVVCTTMRQTACHRRRIKTEEKAKVVAYVWGTEFSQFLAALDIFC